MGSAQLTPPNIVARMLSATATLRSALAGLKQGQITFQLISSAFTGVRQVAEARRAAPTVTLSNNCDFQSAVADYHAALAEWNQQLPRVHGWLLTERNRLAVRRRHTRSLKTWLDANQQTR
jgi:hypothetical protein